MNELKGFYIGSTKDLRVRLSQHNSNKVHSTQNHKWKLVYYESYHSEKDARLREKNLKHFGQGIRRLKDRLVNSIKEISAG